MNRRNARRLTLCVLVGLVILGCASPVLLTPPPPAPVSAPIETVVVQTAVVAQTQTAFLRPPTKTLTATALPTRTATITPTPTATVIFLFLTETSSPEDLLTDEDESDTGNPNEDSDFVKPTATPSEWACRILSKSPANRAIIPGGSEFRAVWTVENTGSKTWPKKGVDVVYHSGADLREGKPYIDMPTTVGPGGKVTITITFTAPKYPKEYSTRWSLRVGKRDFCYIRFAVEVQ